jgi:glycosyltransferase involved in cell wall biosynthesis
MIESTVAVDARPTTRARRGVVFVSYNGLLDPLGASQILPYVERLHRTWPMQILSYERPDRLADAAALRRMEERLARQRIAWTWLRYHKWPSLPATTYDLCLGVATLFQILRRRDIGLVHARGYLPTSIALRASRRHPVLFDIRGLQPEEYVDAGVWRRGELKWLLAKASERRFFRRAAGAVTLSENIQPYVAERFAELGRRPPLAVVPCCVDLERFRFRAAARLEVRRRLRIADDTIVFVYSGSVGPWYLVDEMARFVRLFRQRTGRRVCLLWLVNNGGELVQAASRAHGLGDDETRTAAAPSDEVPDYLSAADVALALIKPSFSKRASSPTKYAECLAVGLPLVVSREVGDSRRISEADGAVALTTLDDEALGRGGAQLTALLERPREHFRCIARNLFDVESVALPTYSQLYDRLALP